MIFEKTTPIGIDFAIDRIQHRFASKLTWPDPYIYGRVYLNTSSNGKVVAEAHIGHNSYKDIFVDKAKSIVIGFVDKGNIDFSGNVQTATVDIICTLNLDLIYGTASRDDEEALQTLIKIVKQTPGWYIQSIRKGNVKEVFNFMDTKNIEFRDMQPYANFAISCKINYLNKC